MRIIFCGTPEYAVPSLRRLARLPGHELVAIVSQPDQPKGRSRAPTPPPVVAAAHALGFTPERIFQPRSLNQSAVLQKLKALAPDLLCVIAFGQLLKPAALALPRLFALNAHGSLLPKFRGAAPIQAALLAGEKETGVSIMKIELGLDRGPVMLRRSLPVGEDDDAGSLHDKLAELSAECFAEALAAVETGQFTFTPQDERAASYASKLTKESGKIDWKLDAEYLQRFIRAMNPWPGAWTSVSASTGGKRQRVRVAKCAVWEAPPGLSFRAPVAECGETAPEGQPSIARGRSPWLKSPIDAKSPGRAAEVFDVTDGRPSGAFPSRGAANQGLPPLAINGCPSGAKQHSATGPLTLSGQGVAQPPPAVSTGEGACATISNEAGIIVRCGRGALLLRQIQPEGGRVMSVAEYLRGAGRSFAPESRWE